MRPATVIALALLSLPAATAIAAPATECTKIGICYCVNDEHKPTIAQRIERFRAVIAEQRKAG